ncbi:MAG: hypothetical protein IPL09_00025 [Bacteroidetes bacterium]|nr:hypothetical protein [Bacteroidota bacterium]
MTAQGNYSNTFILKLNNSGNFVWACQIEGGGITGKKIITDKSNYLYLAGNFSSVIDADPNMGTFQLTGSSNNNLYVIKLDSLANLVWARYLSSINFFFQPYTFRYSIRQKL